jgi:serine/threonine protein phosphatase PrpC
MDRLTNSRRRSASFDYGVVENCALNEAVHISGYAFTFDACAIRGERPYMEDRWCAVYDGAKNAMVMAVYDGHGGAAVSTHLSQYLARAVLEDEALTREPALALKRAFKRVDDDVCKANPGKMRGMYGSPGPGSTAILALMMPPNMYIANVGDSRATALNARGEVVYESRDQRPNVPEERERIVKDGGFVKRGRDGVLRTGGILAVSRAFGNAGIKQFVSVEPEVSVVNLDGVDSLILCSDGLTDVMGSKLASETMRAAPVGVISTSPSPVRTRRVANSLVTLARVRQSRDNISVVVCQSRKLTGAIQFTAFCETPCSESPPSGTPETVKYRPEPSTTTEPVDPIKVTLNFNSDKARVMLEVELPQSGEIVDGLSSPIPNALRDSVQAITPIIHASH